MTIPATANLPRVTYSNIREDFSGVHAVLDQVIAETRANLLDQEWPNFIGGRDSREGQRYSAPCPIDRSLALGHFWAASPAAVAAAVEAARAAQKPWRQMGWEGRVEVLLKAADTLEQRKYTVAAACLLEVGKSRMEAIGEVEEAIDLIRYYCGEMRDNAGYRRDLQRANADEETIDVLRPFGTFAVIAPFNFPVALSIGMCTAALVAGNTVVFKPSPMAGLTGRIVVDCFVAAGLDDGVLNMVCGDRDTGAALAAHPGVDGIAFTGSHAVGMALLRDFGVGGRHAKPVLAEMGGKNPTYVTASADLDTAVSGMIRSAFGLQGEKCSAGSVVFVHETVGEAFIDALSTAAEALKVGDPEDRTVFVGPLINEAAHQRFTAAIAEARAAGATVIGGQTLHGGIYDKGFYVAPAIVVGLPDDHPLHRQELFIPLLTVRGFTELADAVRRGNAIDYGLTAGIYTRNQDELAEFLETAEAGALYANRASGATTGAWPAFQTFCGWKGSGSGSKGGLGAWYVPQFMREQSHTIMR